MLQEQKSNIDTILSYLLIKKLITPIVRTSAYKLKLVNGAGKIIKQPQNKKEQDSLTLLDRIVFHLKRLLGSKLLNLNNFLYLQTINNDFYNKMVVKGTIKQKAEIQRISKDVKKLSEKYNIEFDDIIYNLLTEEIEKEEI